MTTTNNTSETTRFVKILAKLNQQAEAAERTTAVARQLLADSAAEATPEQLVNLATAVGCSIVEHSTYAYAARIVQYHIEAEDGEAIEALTEWVLEQLTQGADDSWSGRGNDRKRTEFDVKVAALKSVLSMVKYTR